MEPWQAGEHKDGVSCDKESVDALGRGHGGPGGERQLWKGQRQGGWQPMGRCTERPKEHSDIEFEQLGEPPGESNGTECASRGSRPRVQLAPVMGPTRGMSLRWM